MASTSTQWRGPFTKRQFCQGAGLVVEGKIKETRVHSMFLSADTQSSTIERQEDNLPTRFHVFVMEVEKAYPRLFVEKRGEQAEVDYVSNEPGVSGYVAPATISMDALKQKVGGGSGHALPNGLLDSRRGNLHPRVPKLFEFWCDSAKPRAKDVSAGHELRVLTLGDSIFVDGFQMLNAKVNLFQRGMGEGGQALSDAWTSGVLEYKEDETLEADLREGCDEDEWSD
ncbi:hypothetical protein QOT17_006048 [Balamuthia mandrillaris]